jgi:hypothetical protein
MKCLLVFFIILLAIQASMLARISHTFSGQIAALPIEIASQVGEDSVHATRPRPLERQDHRAGCASCQRKYEKCGLARISHTFSDNAHTLHDDFAAQMGEKSGLACDKSRYVKQQLDAMPKKDKYILERFFRELVSIDGLGYVLFGSKPMCLTGYFAYLPCGGIFLENDNHEIKAGWQMWRKYETQFPHPSFIFLKETNYVENNPVYCIFVINKKNLRNVLNANLIIFNQELQKNLDVESFISELENKKSIYNLIHFHEGLLGILLGYDPKSAMQYHSRDLILKGELPLVFDGILQPVCCQPFSVLDDIDFIQFVGDPQSDGVKTILKKNREEQLRIQQMYHQDDFLTISLLQLMNED